MRPPSSAPDSLTISKTSQSRKIAGALAHALRVKPKVGIDCLGPANLYTAIKAVIIGAHFLEKQVILDVRFRDKNRNSVALEASSRTDTPPVIHSQMTANKDTDFLSLGGAIANRMRENPTAISITSVGVMASFRSIMACALATTLLAKEDVNIKIIPSFEDTKSSDKDDKDEKSVTFVKLVVIKV